MRSSNAKYLESITSILQLGSVRQVLFMLGIAISVAIGIVLYMSIQEPTYRPLDYQVNPQNLAAIVDTLEKANVKYKINDRDSILYVAADDFQRAKLKLSSAGVAKDDSFNYSFLNDQSNFGSSQFVENARYLRALESDLARTINAIEGLSNARVHIAVPQSNVFADDNTKTTASVMVNIAPGFSSDKEKIRAIIQIVAGSVPGLDPKDVAITDQYGHYLSSGLDQNSIYNAEQLSYQNNIQSYYEKRIESMIVPLLGENKVSVRVYADVDFTQQEEAQEQYDPDKRVILSEQSSSTTTDSSGGASGAPGSLANSAPSDGDKGAAASSSSGGSQGTSQSTKNYDVSKTVSYKKSNVAKIKSLSVAVVVDNEVVIDPKTKQSVTKPIDQDRINKITQLVQATIGYDQARGDKVTVLNSVFRVVKAEAAAPPLPVWDEPWFWDVVKKIIGILFGFILIFIIYRRITNPGSAEQQVRAIKAKRSERVEKVETEATKLDVLDEAKAELQGIKQERINQLKQLANAEPTRVASIIKNWVGK